jgi:hypothetical protein
MKNSVRSLIMIFGIVSVSGPLQAHHGVAAYDTTKTVSVRGTVTDFQFINPHVLISLNMKNDKGEIENGSAKPRVRPCW